MLRTLLRTLVLCLCCDAVQSVGLRTSRGGQRSTSLLSEREQETQCEQGCSFRPFCMDDAKPASCTDEKWQSCDRGDTASPICPPKLRGELCADTNDEVCTNLLCCLTQSEIDNRTDEP